MNTKDFLSRRQVLCGAGTMGLAAGASALMAGCPPGSSPLPDLDTEILNFALNLEYLEAEFYLRAFGLTLDDDDIGENPGTVIGGSEVPFVTTELRAYAREIAEDERAHVKFLRSQLAHTAVDRPQLDFTNAFRALGQAAGFSDNFDPFSNERDFYIGAFVFEDVGVTAYKGASPLVVSRTYLEAAAGILAVEAYHAGLIRTKLWEFEAAPEVDAIQTFLKAHTTEANNISDARDSLDGDDDLDQPVGFPVDGVPTPNIIPSDANGIAFSRSVSQVLRIVYLTPDRGVTQGGFFPNGANGVLPFRTT